MKTKYNGKILDCIALALRPQTRQLTFEGTIRSSKTVTAIEAFFWRVYYSTAKRHLVASLDFETLNNNILDADGFGLLTKFKSYCSELKKDKIGAYYIEVNCGVYGVKKISLCAYGNKAKWKKVLGGSIECIFIDEANIADPQFVNECYSRQVSFENPFTIYTLNGDVPTASIYEHINCSKIVGACPVSIRAEIEKVRRKEGFYYTHWKMQDNPIMTAEKLAAAYALYPAGSYYYTIKILGERGTPGVLIYIDYMDESKLIQKLDIQKYHSFIVSMDVGATRAQNSITLTGFLYDYRGAAFFDKSTFKQVGYAEKTRNLISYVQRCRNIGAKNIESVIIDSAEQNYIEDLKAEFRRLNFPPVIGSYKATIKERIDMGCLLMSRGKLLFNDTEEGREIFGAFKQASWAEGKIGKERKDENEPWNDIVDSGEYGLTRHMKALLRAANEVKL